MSWSALARSRRYSVLARQVLADLREPLDKLLVVAGPDVGVEHRRLEVEVVVHPAEDHVELAHHQLEQVDLGFQHVQDALLDRAAGDGLVSSTSWS